MEQIVDKETFCNIIQRHILPEDWHNLVQAMRSDGIIDENDFDKIVNIGKIVSESMKGKGFSDDIITFVTEAVSIKILEEHTDISRDLRIDLKKRLKDIGYEKYADLLFLILRGINAGTNLNHGNVRSQSELGFVKNLEVLLGYSDGELFEVLAIGKKLSLNDKVVYGNDGIVRKWADILKMNRKQWDVLSGMLKEAEVKEEQFNGIIMQDIKDLGFGVDNWISAMQRLNIDMSGVKMAYVINGLSPEEIRKLESKKPHNVILGTLNEIIGMAEKGKIVYLSYGDRLEKQRDMGIRLVERGNAGPVLELGLCFMLLRKDNPNYIYSEYLNKLVDLGLVSRNEIESLLLGTVQSGIYKLPKIEKVLEMWNELQRSTSYLEIWA